jgi:Nascent polypeptide associated complex NAC
MNPRKMKQMMEQMGIDVTEIEADEVIIKTGDEEIVFDGAQVTRMDAQGQETYQIVGEPETREAGAGASAVESASDPADSAPAAIPDEDVTIVAGRAEVPESDAREALEATDGDLAAAIDRLE